MLFIARLSKVHKLKRGVHLANGGCSRGRGGAYDRGNREWAVDKEEVDRETGGKSRGTRDCRWQ